MLWGGCGEIDMSMIPRNYLRRVVAIGASKRTFYGAVDQNEMDVIGTGFFYDYPSERYDEDGNQLLRRWLVTCEHLIRDAKTAGDSSILFRLNYRLGLGTTVVSIPTYGEYWTNHPEVDVAVTETLRKPKQPEQIDYGKFRSGVDSLRREDCVNKGLHEGDEVFFVGFPTGWVPGRQDDPIVRNGVLAQIQGWINEDHDTFLVDGSGFPGNSGGPVILKPQLMSFDNFGKVDAAFLIGMVAERRFSEIKSTNLSESEKTYMEETADLVEVVSVDDIEQTIELAMEAEENDPDE